MMTARLSNVPAAYVQPGNSARTAAPDLGSPAPIQGNRRRSRGVHVVRGDGDVLVAADDLVEPLALPVDVQPVGSRHPLLLRRDVPAGRGNGIGGLLEDADRVDPAFG